MAYQMSGPVQVWFSFFVSWYINLRGQFRFDLVSLFHGISTFGASSGLIWFLCFMVYQPSGPVQVWFGFFVSWYINLRGQFRFDLVSFVSLSLSFSLSIYFCLSVCLTLSLSIWLLLSLSLSFYLSLSICLSDFLPL